MKWALVIIFFLSIFLLFQNCSQSFQSKTFENSDSNSNIQNVSLIDSIILGADYSWSVLKKTEV